jgi:putative ABC transport system ATP-binding protein
MMIDARAVVKSYGEGAARVEALKGVDLRVARGEFVSIMGASGSGKSTLLNLLAALDVPSSGSIRIDGQEIASMSDDALTLFRRRKIGLVFQAFNLLATLDARDNVLLPVMLERKPEASDGHRAEQLLKEVGLSGRMAHGLSQLSGGETQRVAIARALIFQPPLILADEPTGNLDSVSGNAVLTLLRNCCLRHGASVLMVTHDPRAARVGDRIVTLKDGKIARDDRLQPQPSYVLEAGE